MRGKHAYKRNYKMWATGVDVSKNQRRTKIVMNEK